jgi:hypothetical protein
MAEAASGLPRVGGEPAGSHPKGTVRPEIAAGAGEGQPDKEHGW